MKLSLTLPEDDIRAAVVLLLKERGYDALPGNVSMNVERGDRPGDPDEVITAKVSDVELAPKRGRKSGGE